MVLIFKNFLSNDECNQLNDWADLGVKNKWLDSESFNEWLSRKEK
jgi:hypothetical protein